MTEKWTPGPWACDAYGGIFSKAELPKGRTYGYGCGNDFICDLNDGEYHEYASPEEQRANAHLIAAAPDLYRALEQLVSNAEVAKRVMNDQDGIVSSALFDTIAQANAALAKARGEA